MDVTDIIRHFDNLPHWQQPEGIYFLRTSTLWETAGLLTRRPEVTSVLIDCLRYDDGRRYEMHCWVIMPDHVHLMLRPLRRGEGCIPVAEILQALKGASAHKINRLLGRRGSLWLDEYFDHEVRSNREYAALKHYTWCNRCAPGWWRIRRTGRGTGSAGGGGRAWLNENDNGVTATTAPLRGAPRRGRRGHNGNGRTAPTQRQRQRPLGAPPDGRSRATGASGAQRQRPNGKGRGRKTTSSWRV